MTDQENNLVGGVNASPNDKYLPNLPIITWRFVTAMADGEPHHWRSMGGDAQRGDLQVMFDGSRVINDRKSYDPMRKQGGILLGNQQEDSGQCSCCQVRCAAPEPGSGKCNRHTSGTPNILTTIFAEHNCDIHKYYRGACKRRHLEHFCTKGVEFCCFEFQGNFEEVR
jgi:hypothetical protein